MSNDERARLFVAVWPPRAVTDALASLDRPVIGGVRWTTAAQWHVTLWFLGTCELEPAIAALDEVTGLGSRVAVLGGAPVPLGRRVLAVPVGGLDDVAYAVRDVFWNVGAIHEFAFFRGHVTLARGHGARAVTLPPVEPVSWSVEQIHLVRSHLDQSGPRYENVASVALAQP